MYELNDLTALVINEAIYVHRKLGPGLLESTYESCLIHRLTAIGLSYKSQHPIPVVFEGIKLECGYRADLVIDERLIVEIKAVEGVNDVHKAQVLTYLKLSGLKLGLLINFNVLVLKCGITRIINGF